MLEFDRSTYHYKSRRREQAGLEARIKEICATRIRYGYWRVHVLLRREGWEINLKKTHRIYNELGLQLRNKTPKRRVKAKLRDDRRAASTSNEIWATDFVHDQLATGQRIRVLTVVDTFSGSRPSSIQGSAIGPKTWLRPLKAHRAVEDEGRDHASHRQAGDESGRFPVTMRDADAQSFASAATAMGSSHFGRGPGLIDEDEMLGIEIELLLEPGLAALQDVRAILFAGVRGLFLRVMAWRAKKRRIVP